LAVQTEELLPQEKLMKSLHLMSTKVLPNFTDKIGPLIHPARVAG
jgi:hypothetical protein